MFVSSLGIRILGLTRLEIRYFLRASCPNFVMPAQAGIHPFRGADKSWIPASAGMTEWDKLNGLWSEV
jgi:hypothetical protein